MVEGVIYKYTSPSGKVYIGQTTNEKHRRSTWFCTKRRYAGTAINRARAKYGPENFAYEVLYKRLFLNKELATIELDRWETYFIGMYNSYEKGYNNSIGGSTSRGSRRTDEQRKQMSIIKSGVKQSRETIEKRRRSLKGIKHSKAAVTNRKKLLRTSGRLSRVGQYDGKEGRLIRVWSCIAEAAEALNIVDKNIYRATRTLGKYKGYFWRYYNGDFKVYPKEYTHGTSVEQYTLRGQYIQSFNTITEAAKFIGVKNGSNIGSCCRGKIKSAYGCIWKYKNV